MKNGIISHLAASAAAGLLMFSSLSMTSCAGKKSIRHQKLRRPEEICDK